MEREVWIRTDLGKYVRVVDITSEAFANTLMQRDQELSVVAVDGLLVYLAKKSDLGQNAPDLKPSGPATVTD